jgi:hypothetical protein
MVFLSDSVVCDGVLGNAHLGAGDMKRSHELAAGFFAFRATMLGDLVRGQTSEGRGEEKCRGNAPKG